MISSGDIIGQFKIIEELGRGGMGVVFLAENMTSGEKVALKTVVVQQIEQVQSIRREIHALARIDHPGVVKIINEGISRGLPWYVMELLPGRTLKTHLKALFQAKTTPSEITLALSDVLDEMDTRTVPMGPAERNHKQEVRDRYNSHDASASLISEGQATGPQELSPPQMSTIVSIMRHICATLSFLHGEGIIHQDLKPNNIVIRPDGFPVLVDFGLMSQCGGTVSREVLSLVHTTCGTIQYMAPEQIRGDYVDARADLYAIGCIFYEILTGRPPFFGENVYQLVNAHLNKKPEPLSKYISNIPASLEALILRLLEKNPLRRYGYADDVDRVLASLDTGSDDQRRKVTPVALRPYLYRPSFTGRDKLLGIFMEKVEQLELGNSNLIMIKGDTGSGKTRLLMECARIAATRGFNFLSSECVPGGGLPLQGLKRPLQAIADRCRELGSDYSQRILGKSAGVLGLYEPSLRDMPGLPPKPELAELSPALSLTRLFSYLLETIIAFSDNRPILLLLGDLHWADELTRGFLEYTAHNICSCPAALLIVGTFHSNQDNAELQTFFETSGCDPLELEQLTEKEVSRMIGDMLALETPPQRFSQLLSRYSEGNPFFITEYLRTAVEKGYLQRSRAGVWHLATFEICSPMDEAQLVLPIPHSLKRLVVQRLESLSEQARVLVERAAVIGQNFTVDMLGEMVPSPEHKLIELIEEVIRKNIWQETGHGFLSFNQSIVRETVYSLVSPESLKHFHAQAASAIQRGHAGHLDQFETDLALHYEHAGLTRQAVVWNRRAGERALQKFAHGEALKFFEKTLQLLSPDDHVQRCEILFLRETLWRSTGHKAAQGDDLKELYRLTTIVQDSVLTARYLLRQANFLEQSGAFTESIRTAEEAIHRARHIGHIQLEAEAYLNLGRSLTRQTEYEQAQSKLELCLAMTHVAEMTTIEVDCLNELSSLALKQNDIEKSRVFSDQALTVSVATKNLSGQAQARKTRGQGLQLLNQHDQAIICFDEALALFKETGHIPEQAQTMVLIGLSYIDLKKFRNARDTIDTAYRAMKQTNDASGQATTLFHLGRIAFLLGDYALAGRLFEQSLALFEQGESRQDVATVHVFLSLCNFYLQDLEAALESGQTAVSVADLTSLDDISSLALMALARVLIRLTSYDRAEKILAKALRIRTRMDHQPLLLETRIACARLMMAQGSGEQALQAIKPFINQLLDNSLSCEKIMEPLLLYQTCFEILQQGTNPLAAELIRSAFGYLQAESDKIDDPRMKDAFLTRPPLHNWLMEQYNQTRENEKDC